MQCGQSVSLLNLNLLVNHITSRLEKVNTVDFMLNHSNGTQLASCSLSS